jgi:hypothetical protein
MGMRLGKIAGTLQELSGEELARQQGLSAAPPTPLGAQGIGASQDVAKMAGTPNQIRTMVQDSLMERQRTRDLLGESERTNGRARYSVESLQQKMNVLEGLGSLEGRIPEYVRTQLRTAQSVSVPNKVDVAAIKQHLLGKGMPESAVATAVAAVEKVRNANASAADISEALKALNLESTITDGTTTLAAKLAPFFTDATVDDIKKQISTVLQDFSDVKMKELPEEFARFADQQNNVDDVAAILGLTDEQFGNMTLGEVRAQLKAWKTRNFQDVEILRDVLQDPSYSMAEKDFARQRLAEMGAVGVTSIEQKTNNLEAQVAEGDTVVVGGQAVKVSELMSDPKLKATIATALESDDELAKLEKTDKDLANWIRNNKAALVPVRNELLKGTEKFAQNNKAFADKFGEDSAAYSKLFDSLIPGWKNAKAEDWATWSAEMTKTNPTLISILNEPPSAERTQKFNILAALPTEFAKAFSLANVNAIATAAKGDSAKAVELAKDWYNSSQTDVTGLNSELALQGFAPELDADFPKEDYDSLTAMIVERFTNTNEGLGTYIDRMKKLAAGTAEERSKAMAMYRELGNITGAIKSTLSPTNLKSIKQFSKDRREKNAAFEQKNKELEIAQKRASITPRVMDEVFQLYPDMRNELQSVSNSFKDSYNHLGVIMRAFLNNESPQRIFNEELNFMKKGQQRTPDGEVVSGPYPRFKMEIESMFSEPRTVDKLLLGMSKLLDIDRKAYKDGKGVSSAKWASGQLFKIRDTRESEGRTQAATLSSDAKTLEAERNRANDNYNIFIRGLLAK